MAGALLSIELMQLDMMMLQQQQANQHQQAEHARHAQVRQQQELEHHRQAEARKQSYRNHISQANAHLKDGKTQAAKLEFQQALHFLENDPQARFGIACCLVKQHDHHVAYDMFMQLRNCSPQPPGLEEQIQDCVAELIRVSTKHLQKAKSLYAAGSAAEALNELGSASPLVPIHSQEGQKLEAEIDSFIKQIEWVTMRIEVAKSLAFGEQQLKLEQFTAAENIFTRCANSYQEYAAHLSEQERRNREQLTTLLAQAQRGVRLHENARLQGLINAELFKIRQALEQFDMNTATTLLTETRKLSEQIKIDDPADITADYQSQAAFDESLLKLQQWKTDYQTRCQGQSRSIASSILITVTGTMPLSSKDTRRAQQIIETLISINWQELDRRNLDALEALLVTQTRLGLHKTNCVYTCLYAGYYVADPVKLESSLLSTILSNLPNDDRELITLPVLAIAGQPAEESDRKETSKMQLKMEMA